jgi:hypothetical protein
LDGDGGATRVGGDGAVESSTKRKPGEQAELDPAASVAVARKVVELSSGTVTTALKAPLAEAVVVAIALPVQSGVTKMRTVAPAAAVPETTGSFALAGEAGAVVAMIGAGGGGGASLPPPQALSIAAATATERDDRTMVALMGPQGVPAEEMDRQHRERCG